MQIKYQNDEYFAALRSIIDQASLLFLFNHASTGRTYSGSIIDKRTYRQKLTLISLLLGLYRLLKIAISDLMILKKFSHDKSQKNLEFKEFIFVPASALQDENGEISTRFHSNVELEGKCILTTALSLGFKNRKIKKFIQHPSVIFIEQELRFKDIIWSFLKTLIRLLLYVRYSIQSNEYQSKIYQEAMEYIHTEYSSVLLHQAINLCNFKNKKQINYTHFEFEFGRAISLAFDGAERIGRAHGLIHEGKTQFITTKYLSAIYPKYFPKSYEVEDKLGKEVFPNAKILKKKRQDVDVDIQCKRLHIICSLHTTYEEIVSVIQSLGDSNLYSIHYHPRMGQKACIKSKLNFGDQIDHAPRRVGAQITGFESRFILECLNNGARYIPHRIDAERSEYLENSIPSFLGMN